MESRKAKKFNFEQSLHDLETIVKELEDGGLNLETALKNFERGINLVRACQSELTAAEQRVQILTTNNNNENLKPYEDLE